MIHSLNAEGIERTGRLLRALGQIQRKKEYPNNFGKRKGSVDMAGFTNEDPIRESDGAEAMDLLNAKRVWSDWRYQ